MTDIQKVDGGQMDMIREFADSVPVTHIRRNCIQQRLVQIKWLVIPINNGVMPLVLCTEIPSTENTGILNVLLKDLTVTDRP